MRHRTLATLFFISIFAIFSAHVSAADDVSPGDVIQRYQELFPSSHPQCASAKAPIPEPTLDEIRAGLCEAFKAYPRKPPKYSFTDPKVKDPCADIWHNNHRLQSQDMKSAFKSRQAYAAAPDSKRKMLDFGFTVATAKEKAFITKHLEAFRDDVASECCGSDKDCSQAMGKVRIMFCQPPDNENAPDGCTTNVGAYNSTPTEGPQILWNTYYAMVNNEKEFGTLDTNFARRQVATIKHLVDPQKVHSVMPGMIILSPYVRDGHCQFPDDVITHELGHACSSIKRQLSVIRKKARSAIEATLPTFNHDPKDPRRCMITPGALAAYRSVFSNLSGGTQIVNCLKGLTDNLSNPKSQAYHSGACALASLEESTGDVFQMSASGEVFGKSFIMMCNTLPDDNHPSLSHVSQCLLQYSAPFRKLANENLNCAGDAK